jgi:hypothetical protein
MKNNDKALRRTNATDFTAGVPNKKNPSDSIVNKAYALGYQQAALMNGIQAFQAQQQQAQQEMAMAAQQLLQLQAAATQESAKAKALSEAQAAAPPPMAPPGVPGMGPALSPDVLQSALAGPPPPGGLMPSGPVPPAAAAPMGGPVPPMM